MEKGLILMIRVRHLAPVAAVGLATAFAAPAALAVEPAAAPAASQTVVSAVATSVSPVGYADRTIQAFGAGNQSVYFSHTTAAARVVINRHDAAPTHWQRVSAEGAAGHVYVTYVNSVTHDRLTIGVNTTEGTDHDHLVDQAR